MLANDGDPLDNTLQNHEHIFPDTVWVLLCVRALHERDSANECLLVLCIKFATRLLLLGLVYGICNFLRILVYLHNCALAEHFLSDLLRQIDFDRLATILALKFGLIFHLCWLVFTN